MVREHRILPFLDLRSDPVLAQPLLDLPSTQSSLQVVKQDAKEIGDKLVGFEDAWHMIRLASSNLLQNVELASTVMVRTLNTLYGIND